MASNTRKRKARDKWKNRKAGSARKAEIRKDLRVRAAQKVDILPLV